MDDDVYQNTHEKYSVFGNGDSRVLSSDIPDYTYLNRTSCIYQNAVKMQNFHDENLGSQSSQRSSDITKVSTDWDSSVYEDTGQISRTQKQDYSSIFGSNRTNKTFDPENQNVPHKDKIPCLEDKYGGQSTNYIDLNRKIDDIQQRSTQRVKHCIWRLIIFMIIIACVNICLFGFNFYQINYSQTQKENNRKMENNASDPYIHRSKSYAVAFKAVWYRNTTTTNVTFQFTNVMLDIGLSFNPLEGSFNASIKGIYCFCIRLTGTLKYRNLFFKYISIHKNNLLLHNVISRKKHSTASIFIMMDRGDALKPDWTKIVEFSNADSVIFSGFLASPLSF